MKKLERSAIRVEQHQIDTRHASYALLASFCHKAKNLYNHANYLVRHAFFEEKQWLRYGTLDKLLKEDTEYPDYKEMPTAQSAQQILRALDGNWASFFASIKDYSKNKQKYLGRPKPPNYLKKDGFYELVLTNQNCKIKGNKIQFPKVFEGFFLTPRCIEREDFLSLQQVRIVPKGQYLVVEVVYKIQLPKKKEDKGRYVGIDIGVSNLATVGNTIGKPAFILNGRPLKSMNQYYNKKISYYRSVAKRMNQKEDSKRMAQLTKKRMAKIEDYLHKVSRYLIEYCKKEDISKIVIGQNKEWKQESPLGKVVNQSFVQIPFAKFLQMIQYKAEEVGITVILTEESYTSGTSFLDGETPTKANYNKARRVHRGLFVSNAGIPINADLNGAYQILKKVVPIEWDRGWALHPVVVNIR